MMHNNESYTKLQDNNETQDSNNTKKTKCTHNICLFQLVLLASLLVVPFLASQINFGRVFINNTIQYKSLATIMIVNSVNIFFLPCIISVFSNKNKRLVYSCVTIIHVIQYGIVIISEHI